MNVSAQPETPLDLIEAGELDRFGDYFWAMATTGQGVVQVANVGTDWDCVTPADFSPAETDPVDGHEAMRWCVLFDDIFECDSETAVIAYLDPSAGSMVMQTISGPEHDHHVAARAIAARIGATSLSGLPVGPKWADRVRAKRATTPAPKVEKAAPMKAANDNEPATKRFSAIDAETLLGMHFAPVKYVIPGFVAEGLTILGGRPKLGKSWLALGFGVGVATGGPCLGVTCDQGDALYLALEDNQRRLQDRLRIVLPKFRRPDMSRLCLQTEAPKVGAGLIEMLDAWRKSVEDPRLIIIDTLAIVRPPKKGNQDSYAADYEALSPLQRFASEHRLAVVVVTHVRKMEAADPLEMISGTNGLTGAADSIMVLDRNTDGAKLYGRGRDVEEVEKALKFDSGIWTALGDVDDVKRSDQRRQIMDALALAGEPMKPSDVAKATGMTVANVTYLLRKMVEAGEAEKQGYGLYTPASDPSDSSESAEINSPSVFDSEESEDSEGGGESDLELAA
ncbi:AAA family ATPase [Devosia sp. CAU 1758]